MQLHHVWTTPLLLALAAIGGCERGTHGGSPATASAASAPLDGVVPHNRGGPGGIRPARSGGDRSDRSRSGRRWSICWQAC